MSTVRNGRANTSRANFVMRVSAFARVGLVVAMAACTSEPPTVPTPVLSSAEPAILLIRSKTTTIVLRGSNFEPDAQVQWIKGILAVRRVDLTTRFVSSTRLDVSLGDSLLTEPGEAILEVVNPSPNGRPAARVTIQVVFPKPQITRIIPDTAVVGGPPMMVEIQGGPFVIESTLEVTGVSSLLGQGSAPPFVNDSTIRFILSDFALISPRPVQVEVLNPGPGGGRSNPASIAVRYPTPIITAITPDSIEADANPGVLTIDGTAFVPPATVMINGRPLPAVSIAPKTLRVVVGPDDLTGTSPLSVTVVNRSPSWGPSPAMPVRRIEAPPRIAAVIPSTITAGSPTVALTVTGANFAPSDQVRWNGVPLPRAVGSSTSITATLAAELVASAGSGAITVRSAIGPRTSAPLVVPVLPQTPVPAGVMVVNQGASALIADPLRNRLYAAVGANASRNPNSIAIVDPTTATVVGTIAVPGNPRVLALSDDARYLYVGVTETGSIWRIDLATGIRDLEIRLGSITPGPILAERIVVLEGNPSAIAVSLQVPLIPRHHGVAIFDDGIARPLRSQGHTGSNRITRGNNAEELYGFGNDGESGLRRLRVSGRGVTEEIVRASGFDGSEMEMMFDGGYLYFSNGGLADARRLQRIGAVPDSGLFAPDAARGRVHYYRGTTLSTCHYLSGELIRRSEQPLGLGAVAMARVGVSGIALATRQAIVLINDSFIGPTVGR